MQIPTYMCTPVLQNESNEQATLIVTDTVPQI